MNEARDLLLFDAQMHFTGNVAYGFSMDRVIAGEPLPSQGVRFDVTFEGRIEGSRLNGTITGIDYVSLSAAGVTGLYIRGRITTDDGHNIALVAEGEAAPRPGSALADLRETLFFSTAAPGYEWLNELQAEGAGVVDSATGEIQLKVFAGAE